MANKNNYRVDIVLVDATQAELTKMQAQLNQWMTKGELIKYEIKVVDNKVLFNICRTKGE
jgi:hypothetical protein